MLLCRHVLIVYKDHKDHMNESKRLNGTKYPRFEFCIVCMCCIHSLGMSSHVGLYNSQIVQKLLCTVRL